MSVRANSRSAPGSSSNSFGVEEPGRSLGDRLEPRPALAHQALVLRRHRDSRGLLSGRATPSIMPAGPLGPGHPPRHRAQRVTPEHVRQVVRGARRHPPHRLGLAATAPGAAGAHGRRRRPGHDARPAARPALVGDRRGARPPRAQPGPLRPPAGARRRRGVPRHARPAAQSRAGHQRPRRVQPRAQGRAARARDDRVRRALPQRLPACSDAPRVRALARGICGAAGLARDYATALERLARRAAERGDRLEAVEWWRKLAAQDPLNGRVPLA